MGEVFSGEHLAVGVKVALKRLLVAAAESHEVVARFKREAVLLGKIRSDHVARVLDFVTDETFGLILVMEFIEGDPLSKILGARTLSVEETIDLGADISAALVDLHRHHIVHRDLKPGNIIWQTLPNGQHRAVIVDFGVSRALSQGGEEDEEMTGITRADMALGTIEYMAPEQILNSRDVTPASDIYALGAILFRAHAGKHVFGDVYDAELAKKKIWTDPPSLQTGRSDKLSRSLEAVVNRTLVRSPKKRYAQAEEVLAELNMLRDLIKAASFDIDTMTTRDNSAILEALAVAEAKKGEPATIPQGPASAREATPASNPQSGPTSAPAHSSGSLGAATTPIRQEPRVAKRGVSTAIALLGILVAGLGGTILGTRLGPTGGGVLTALGMASGPDAPVPAATTAAPAVAAATASAAAEPSASASAAPDSTAAPVASSADPAASAAADASAAVASVKPKLQGKLPDARATAASATATTTPEPTMAGTTTAATTPTATAPAPKPTATTMAPSPKPTSNAPPVNKDLF